MKKAIKYLDKTEFINCMDDLSLDRVSDIAALFGKSEQSIYKYLNVDSKTEIPNVVVAHLTTIALMGGRQKQIIEKALMALKPMERY
jgi:hypothetical protein